MAVHENGVGVSYKLPDGTIVWSHRDTWAEVLEDMGLILGEEGANNMASKLQGQAQQQQAIAPVVNLPTGAPDAQLGQVLDLCPKCGQPKTKLVPAGVSKKSGKPYPAFFACAQPGH